MKIREIRGRLKIFYWLLSNYLRRTHVKIKRNMKRKVIFFSSLIIILIALYIYSFIEDIKSYDSFSFLLAKGFLKTIPLALIIAKWLKEFKKNNWVFSDPFQEYSALPQLPLLTPSFSSLSPFGIVGNCRVSESAPLLDSHPTPPIYPIWLSIS